MWGPPKDVEGECNARLYLGDDYGDGTTTIRCKLEPGHEGDHEKRFERDGDAVKIQWAKDESFVCSRCQKRATIGNDYDGTCCYKCPKCGTEGKHYGAGPDLRADLCLGCDLNEALDELE